MDCYHTHHKSIKWLDTKVKEDSKEERASCLILPLKPREIIQSDYSVLDASDIVKELQISKDHDFMIHENQKRICEKDMLKLDITKNA
jgi:hypothetical protein